MAFKGWDGKRYCIWGSFSTLKQLCVVCGSHMRIGRFSFANSIAFYFVYCSTLGMASTMSRRRKNMKKQDGNPNDQ